MRLLGAMLAFACLAGCAEPGTTPQAAPPEDAPSAFAIGRDFVVDYTYYVEECGTGYNTYQRGSATTVTIPRPDNVTTLDLTFTWEAASALAETLRFALVGPDGYDTAVVVEGRSPLAWRVDGEGLQATKPDPWIAGTPVDCTRPAGVGSAPDQAVHVDAVWT